MKAEAGASPLPLFLSRAVKAGVEGSIESNLMTNNQASTRLTWRGVRAFLWAEKDFALASIAVVLVLLAFLLVSFEGRGVGPFVYARF